MWKDSKAKNAFEEDAVAVADPKDEVAKEGARANADADANANANAKVDQIIIQVARAGSRRLTVPGELW